MGVSSSAGVTNVSGVGGLTGVGAQIYDYTNTPAGTTGAQTINKPSGTVNFAATASSVVVTNSLCTINSLIFGQLRKSDVTFTNIKSIVPAAGSFTIVANNAATAETSVGWLIINQ